MPSATATPPPPAAPSFNAYRILSLPSPFNNTRGSYSSSSTAAPPPTALSPAVIKAAYRRALLTHHPDKQQQQQQQQSNGGAHNVRRAHTVDAITAAYKTLLDPAARAAHDRALRLRRGDGGGGRATTKGTAINVGVDGVADDDDEEEEGEEGEEEWRLGLEAVDLDDLEYDEATGRWWRECRCGAERGFMVDEEALEEAAAGQGGSSGGSEVLVGCVGCSLWIRVGFAVAED